jgi:tetratricopeptide (TPR) repeat protein
MGREVVPNNELTAARKALPSPSGSGRPMSRQELADLCNAALDARYLEQGRGRRWAGLTEKTVGALERGETRWPNDDYRWALCTVLKADERSLGLYIDRPHDSDATPHLANALAGQIAAPKLSRRTLLGTALPGALESMNHKAPFASIAALLHVEQVRRSLTDAVSAVSVGGAELDEWDAVVHNHGQATRFRPAPQMIAELLVDFDELQQLLVRRHSASALRRLTRATAQMAGLMFLTLIKLNEPLAARNWARTARIAAEEAGDNDTRAWVRAQEAYVHYYAGNLAEAVAVARQAQAIAGRSPCVGAPLAAALEARALAAQGDRAGAVSAIMRAEAALFTLDADGLMPSAFGYSEAQLRFHEGNAYTHLHDTAAARAAQERALSIAPVDDFLDRALIHLDTASCLVRDREFPEAIRVASRALLDLTPEQREGLAVRRGMEVFLTLPKTQQTTADGRDLHEVLISSKGAI